MGATSSKDLLKKYWTSSRRGLTQSQDDRAVKKCFDSYDVNKSGALELEEALAYINDLLRVSGLDKKIRDEAQSIGQNPQDYYGQYVMNIFKEMDKHGTGRIEFADLLKPKETLWTDFMRFVSVKTLHEAKMAKRRNERGTSSKSARNDSDSETASNSSDASKEDGDKDRTPNKGKKSRRKGSKSERSNTTHKKKSKKHTDKEKSPTTDMTKEPPPAKKTDVFSEAEKLKISGRAALTESGIMAMRDKEVGAVVEILNLDYAKAQALLNFYRWDKEKLLADWADDYEKVCKLAGIDLSDNTTTTSASKSGPEEQQNNDDPIECTICAEETTEYTTLPGCGHQFCNTCWGENLAIQIKEGHTLDIHCMAHKCTQLVPEHIVKKLVPQDLYKNSKTARWCPAPDCGKAIVEPIWEGDNVVGQCSCGTVFCWRCMREAHTPLDCEMMKVWDERNVEDLASLALISESTKPCPKCKTPIEKNDGCFMMTCAKAGCYHEFCWLCLEPWYTHSDHFRCAKYSDGVLSNVPEWRDKSKAEVFSEALSNADVYFRWITRYEEYDKALKLEERNWKETLQKIKRVVEHNPSMDPSFLIEAHKQLQKSRRILKYVCVALCIEKDQIKQQLMQEFHAGLEMVTEKLAQKSERHQDVQTMNSSEIRELTRVLRKSIHRLLGEDEE